MPPSHSTQKGKKRRTSPIEESIKPTPTTKPIGSTPTTKPIGSTPTTKPIGSTPTTKPIGSTSTTTVTQDTSSSSLVERKVSLDEKHQTEVEPTEYEEEEEEVVHKYLKQSRRSWSKVLSKEVRLNLGEGYDTESNSDDASLTSAIDPEISKVTPLVPTLPPTTERRDTPRRGRTSSRRGAVKAVPKIAIAAAYNTNKRRRAQSRFKNTTKKLMSQSRSEDLKDGGLTENAIRYLDESNQLPKLPQESDITNSSYQRDELVDMLMTGVTPYNVPLTQSSTERQSEKVLEDRHKVLMDFVRHARDEFGDILFSSIDEKTMEPETLYNLLREQPNLLTYFVTPRYSSGPPIPSQVHTAVQYFGSDHPKRKNTSRRGGDCGPSTMPEIVIRPSAPAAFHKNKHEPHILPSSVWSLNLPSIGKGSSMQMKDKEPQSPRNKDFEVVTLPPISG